MRIAFMTTLGRNVGDEFIREGIRSFFDEAVGAYDAFYVCKHDLASLHERRLDEREILQDKFRDADIIVQAGAPVYWSVGKSRCYDIEWAQSLWYDRIFQLGPEKLIFNLGAGACQASESDLNVLLGDPRCADFAREVARACAWTTVRDPLAGEFLSACGLPHELLPCPAFHAARRFPGGLPRRVAAPLAVNLMPLAGHYRLKPQTDGAMWKRTVAELLPKLRRNHRLIFVAHDQKEADFQEQFLVGGEIIFQTPDYRDYVKLYSHVEGIVANRVHGAVCVAGFGRPAVIVGNDSRIGIARPIGIPACDSSQVSAGWIVDSLEEQFARGRSLAEERIELRESSAQRYVARIKALVQAAGFQPIAKREVA
jgi:hypothetical protein